MKKMIALCLLLLSITACHSVAPGPGEEAVLVDKPYIFGSGGVQPETVKTGRQFTYLSTEAILVKTTPQVVNISFNDFSSSDNILLDFSTAIQYKIKDPAVLLSKFGADWFKNNIENQYTAIVRNAVKSHTMSDMMSGVTVSAEVDDQVTKQIRELVKENNIPVDIIGITLGRALPNPSVLTQMNETAAQQQRQKTLAAAVLAEQERAKEQEAKAVADNAYRNALGLNPQQYVNREIAQMYADACSKSKNCIITTPGASILVSPTN